MESVPNATSRSCYADDTTIKTRILTSKTREKQSSDCGKRKAKPREAAKRASGRAGRPQTRKRRHARKRPKTNKPNAEATRQKSGPPTGEKDTTREKAAQDSTAE